MMCGLECGLMSHDARFNKIFTRAAQATPPPPPMQKRSRRSPIRNRGDFMLLSLSLSLLLHPAPSRDSHYEKLTNTSATGCDLATTSAQHDRSLSRNLARKSPLSTRRLSRRRLIRLASRYKTKSSNDGMRASARACP